MKYNGFTRSDMVQGLRELADFIEAHPNVPVSTSSSVTVNGFCRDKETFVAALKHLADAPQRVIDNSGSSPYPARVERTRAFGNGAVELGVSIAAELVCKERKVTREVTVYDFVEETE